jgi:hypothetical protein
MLDEQQHAERLRVVRIRTAEGAEQLRHQLAPGPELAALRARQKRLEPPAQLLEARGGEREEERVLVLEVLVQRGLVGLLNSAALATSSMVAPE